VTISQLSLYTLVKMTVSSELSLDCLWTALQRPRCHTAGVVAAQRGYIKVVVNHVDPMITAETCMTDVLVDTGVANAHALL